MIGWVGRERKDARNWGFLWVFLPKSFLLSTVEFEARKETEEVVGFAS